MKQEDILLAKQGDQAALEAIVADYKPLIRSLANKFYLVGGDKDDLLQEGMLGLYFAVQGYDANKGAFASFVKLCVTRQILDAVKKDGAYLNKPLSGYVELSTVEDELPLCDNPLENLLKREYAEKVGEIIDTQLTVTEKQVLALFAQGYSYDDISAKLNKSYKAVDGALQRARKKLQQIKE